MTTKELADLLTPMVRDAVARSKDEILSGMPPVKRAAAWALWPFVLGVGVPLVTRIDVEFSVYNYRKRLEPYLGPLIDLWIAANKDSKDEDVRWISDLLGVLKQPPEEFLMVVQDIVQERKKRGQ